MATQKEDKIVRGADLATIGSLLKARLEDIAGCIESVTSQQDGTIVITLDNEDEITIDLNHSHPAYPKYVLLQNEAAYNALTTKESDTLYLIPKTTS